MSQRFFIPELHDAASLLLQGPELEHLAKVMRAKVGDSITVFDGAGTEAVCQITSIDRRQASLQLLSKSLVSRELPGQLVLGVGLPKGERQQWLVEKAVELGVTRLVPLALERSVAKVDSAVTARLERWVIEASKQCGRNHLMQIAPAASWLPFLQMPEVPSPNRSQTACTLWRMVLDPGGAAWPGVPAAPGQGLAGQGLVGLNCAWAAIGSEGGFSPEEISQAQAAGWNVVSLGPRVLRVETAVAAVAALLGKALE